MTCKILLCVRMRGGGGVVDVLVGGVGVVDGDERHDVAD